MILAIDGVERHAYPDLVEQMFRMRAAVFSERLGWDVSVVDGKEIDRFDDPVLQTGPRRLLLIDWADFSSDDRVIRQSFGEASEHGLGRRGMSFPAHGHLGDRALISVTADVSDREWQWACRTAFRQFPVIATHLHDVVIRTAGVEHALPHLSPRKRECLLWTSEGKTVWECGMILGLSPHTVRCYLESARHKLGASSNTHAVSIAAKSGLLFDLP